MAQAQSVGVRRTIEDIVHRTGLNYLAGIHDRHIVSHFSDDAQIVGDQNDAHAMVLLQLVHHFEGLGLNGDIQGRGRLVGHQQEGIAGHAHGDDGALEHPA